MKTLPSLAQTVEQFGLRTKKTLGQHFLLDSYICEQIVALAGDLKGIHVIEIGPGPGGLTRALLSSDAAHVSAIELDARAIPALEQLQTFSDGRLTIRQEDALNTATHLIGDAPRAIIANLPYNIGSELLIGWLNDIAKNPNTYERLILMFQREVGERLVAQPRSKAYGRLSVLCQWLCETELRLDIPRDAFSPPPKVESVIVELRPRAKPLYDAPKEALEKVLAVAFQQRRKMLRSAVKSLNLDLGALAIDDTLRPDQISIEQFALMAHTISQ